MQDEEQKLQATIDELAERITMREPEDIYAAIAAVQSKLDPVDADCWADVRSEKGGYSYGYASLAQIWKNLRPLVAEAKIALVYDLFTGENGMVVRLRAIHTPSSTSHEVQMPLVGHQGTMQGLGALFSYARRYLLHLCFALAIQGEDQGEGERGVVGEPKKASGKRKSPGARIREQQEAHEAGRPLPATDGGKLLPGQVTLINGTIKARAKQLADGGISEADIRSDLLRAWEVADIDDLDPARFNRVLSDIRGWEPPVGEVK